MGGFLDVFAPWPADAAIAVLLAVLAAWLAAAVWVPRRLTPDDRADDADERVDREDTDLDDQGACL